MTIDRQNKCSSRNAIRNSRDWAKQHNSISTYFTTRSFFGSEYISGPTRDAAGNKDTANEVEKESSRRCVVSTITQAHNQNRRKRESHKGSYQSEGSKTNNTA